MKKPIFLVLVLNISVLLSACAATTSSSGNDPVSKPPLSRHDRFWNLHLEAW